MKYKNSLFYRYIGSAFAHPKNFLFCLSYPFMKSRNVWTGKFIGYGHIMLDDFEYGWRKAFGLQFCKDIKKAFKEHKIPKHKWSKEIYWEQIKEKWGKLCLYASAPEYIQDILEYYESISSHYCCRCGKPAKYWSCGWICPFCTDCKIELEHDQHMIFEEMTHEEKN